MARGPGAAPGIAGGIVPGIRPMPSRAANGGRSTPTRPSTASSVFAVPTYAFVVAMFLMIGLMLPFFFLAMYERDGLPLEKVLKNIIRTRFLYPRVRPYETENFYALLSARKEAQPIAKQQKGRKARRQKA